MREHLRYISIPAVILVGIGIFLPPMVELFRLSQSDPLYSHVLLIPAVSIYLIWISRKAIFSRISPSPFWGGGLLCVSGLLWVVQKYAMTPSNPNDALSVAIAGMILWVLGGFVLACGWRTFREAMFPLLFLAFMLPIPTVVLDPVVRFLQLGSVEATQFILKVLNVPAYRDGVMMSLPGVTVEIAEECSGIRSSVALLVLSTVAGYIFLKSNWRRWILVLMVIPVSIFKNGMRITTLSLLGSYVDMSYITDSALHSAGGKPFFVVAVVMMSPVFWLLRKSEVNGHRKDRQNTAPEAKMAQKTSLTKDTPVLP